MRKAPRDPKQQNFQLREARLDITVALTRPQPDAALLRAPAGAALDFARSQGR